MIVYHVPIAQVCVECRRPFWSQNIRKSCTECGDVMRCMVFECRCTDKPVYAVAPDGRCEYCGELLCGDREIWTGDMELLRQLLKRMQASER